MDCLEARDQGIHGSLTPRRCLDDEGYTFINDISECKFLDRELTRIGYAYEVDKWAVSWRRSGAENKWKIHLTSDVALTGFHKFDACVRARPYRQFTALFAAIVPYIINDDIRNATICRWRSRWAKNKKGEVQEVTAEPPDISEDVWEVLAEEPPLQPPYLPLPDLSPNFWGGWGAETADRY
jgi:hypothetical protein